ncbi:MAG: hypothetical protein ACM3JD_10815 [Rudaea sp.]
MPNWILGGAASERDWRKEWRAAALPARRPSIAEVEVGIDRVYVLIQRGRLMVFDDLDELHDEQTTYSRELDDNGNATEKIEDKASYHLLDALRYIGGELAESRKRALSARTVEFYAC